MSHGNIHGRKRLAMAFAVFLFVITESMTADVASHEPIKALIVDGFSNHNWPQTTRVVKSVLEQKGLFAVDVTTVPVDDPNALANWRPLFTDYGLIIQNTNNISNKKLRWPREAEIALEKYVSTGGGLYILHSANNAFSHWPEYDRMIGLGWRSANAGTALEIDPDGGIIRIPPGQGKGTSHGKRFDTVIHILNRHPINQGFPEAWKTPSLEVYNFPRGPAENLTVLSWAHDKATNRNWPTEWVVAYGAGRVYNFTFGHLWKHETQPDSIRCIGFQTTRIRASQWLAGRNVTWPVPQNFPTESTISLAPLTPQKETASP